MRVKLIEVAASIFAGTVPAPVVAANASRFSRKPKGTADQGWCDDED
ncbi:hypothetical protein HUF15_40255 [Streptomyces samsunensis]|nr:hypothetical protein [Streptomyces samsunensis]NUH42858.1 hypothetical protein [Streptomyces samsunensis]